MKRSKMTTFGMRGRIENRTNRALWVVETDSLRPTAHRLDPFKKTPPGVDADGVKSVDGTPISGHDSWWKIGDTEWATITESGGVLMIDSFPSILKRKVGPLEFGNIVYDNSTGWGH